MRNWFKGRFSKIREINRKYGKPRVKMTKGVKVALFLLRLYLILLVGILVLKFISMVKK
ncbi:MAG: hypothetical protein NT006_07500 [Candidatus Aminicenantes bacterium]|nr:hypothetical protein [Candidatus Aminicenantes bacterium]